MESELRRFTRAEYEKLTELGLFDDEKVELLNGLVFPMSPQGDDHWSITSLIGNILTRALPVRYGVAMHSQIWTSEDSAPEPDVVVFDRDAFPNTIPDQALLVIEVSRQSLQRDRNVKLPLYARANVQEYWIVVLAKHVVEVYTEPRDGEYAQKKTLAIGDTLRPQFDPTIEIAMSTLPWA